MGSCFSLAVFVKYCTLTHPLKHKHAHTQHALLFLHIHIHTYVRQSHFPNRGSRSVHDKWSRTLDPNYEFDKHFTQEEDARLSQLHGNTVDWKAQEQHFPGRLSQSLIKRWKELVSTEQLADDYSRNLKRKFKEFNQEDVVVRVKAKEP
jgi:hypothetical protein